MFALGIMTAKQMIVEDTEYPGLAEGLCAAAQC